MTIRYLNGRWPNDLLVQFDTGGGKHVGTVGTRAKWYTLRANVKAKYGKTLQITPGWNVYRPYPAQEQGRKDACAAGNCNGAASAGYSSHGGNWNGRDTLAIDVGNYGIIGREAFFAEARAAGFQPGLITQEISGIKGGEPWHIIDFEPFGGVPSGGGAIPIPLPVDSKKEDLEDMPINFQNAATGLTYTMIPGVSIRAHTNGFGSRLTNYINTGVWPASESNEDRWAAGLRNLQKDHITWMLPEYGFSRLTADSLPAGGGIVWSDAIQSLLDSEKTVKDSITPGQSGVKTDGQLWSHISQSGGSTTLTDAQIDAIASKIKVPGVDNAAIAKAVRDGFRTDPLK